MDTTFGQNTIYLAVLYLSFMWMAAMSRINIEDEVLKKEFRTKWAEWARSVRYKIIPWIF
jgi:protein-S-isoprenylcysteine O-methyltransferase Ste14